jgi:2-keto-4-pentenoate hydratase
MSDGNAGMQMTADRTRAAAEILVAARRDRRALRGLPDDLRPTGMAEALAIQEACAAARGMAPAGWKIGCTAPESRILLETDGPFPGRAFAPLVFDSLVELAAADFPMQGVEVEFAFRMGRDLPPRAAPYTAEEAGAAADALYPAIEVVSCVLDGWLDYGVESIVADNGAHGALVLGRPVPDWRSRDLAAHRVALSLDGMPIAEGRGAAVLGHPLAALAWLANHLSARGLALAAGEVVTTGTMTNFNRAPADTPVVADFGDMGEVRLVFRA